IVSRVALRTHEPATVLAHIGVEHLVPELVPRDVLGGLGPEPFRVLLPAGVDLVISAHPASSPSRHHTRVRSPLLNGELANDISDIGRMASAVGKPRLRQPDTIPVCQYRND